MTDDLRMAALRRYHDTFDPARYDALADQLASTLYTERDDTRVSDGMVALQDACLDLCGHPDCAGACQRLAVFCGLHALSVNMVDALRDELRRFAPDDVRIDDFDGTARALLHAYSGLHDLRTAAACANGVHSWQGRMAYALLHAVEYLTLAALVLLQHGDEAYIREKLQNGLQRITGLFIFRGTYFPDERDRASSSDEPGAEHRSPRSSERPKRAE
jgi:hypothetical protein